MDSLEPAGGSNRGDLRRRTPEVPHSSRTLICPPGTGEHGKSLGHGKRTAREQASRGCRKLRTAHTVGLAGPVLS